MWEFLGQVGKLVLQLFGLWLEDRQKDTAHEADVLKRQQAFDALARRALDKLLDGARQRRAQDQAFQDRLDAIEKPLPPPAQPAPESPAAPEPERRSER